jgi:hypothetical protein
MQVSKVKSKEVNQKYAKRELGGASGIMCKEGRKIVINGVEKNDLSRGGLSSRAGLVRSDRKENRIFKKAEGKYEIEMNNESNQWCVLSCIEYTGSR